MLHPIRVFIGEIGAAVAAAGFGAGEFGGGDQLAGEGEVAQLFGGDEVGGVHAGVRLCAEGAQPGDGVFELFAVGDDAGLRPHQGLDRLGEFGRGGSAGAAGEARLLGADRGGVGGGVGVGLGVMGGARPGDGAEGLGFEEAAALHAVAAMHAARGLARRIKPRHGGGGMGGDVRAAGQALKHEGDLDCLAGLVIADRGAGAGDLAFFDQPGDRAAAFEILGVDGAGHHEARRAFEVFGVVFLHDPLAQRIEVMGAEDRPGGRGIAELGEFHVDQRGAGVEGEAV